MKRIISFIIALVLAMGSAAFAEAETRTVTDIFGREVVVPTEIHTAVALGSAARLMCYAGATDRLIGVTETDMKASPNRPYSYIFHDDLSKCIPMAEGSDGADYYEAIVDAYPDVIFYFDSDSVALEDLAAKTGLPVVGVYAQTCFHDTFYHSLDLIGEIMGTKERTDAVVASLKGWAEELQKLTADVADEDKPTVYAGAVNWSGVHGIEGTYGQYAPFVAVNARNVVDETGAQAFVEVNQEQIIAWDPDYIFLTISNMDIINEDYANNPDFYNALSAVQNGNVYSQVSFNSYWCNLELAVLDAYYVGYVLYPDAFEEIDFNEKADEIFNVMLGSDYVDVMAENGMSFCQLTIGK